ncbi:MAG: anhydro-N-acetylmuramic acid kinase [Cocleimonas sp.]|jgi:anhydro-N-acetylmuramic acid kinase
MSSQSMSNQNLYIGLMSGTSLDSIDVVLVDLSKDEIRLIASHSHELPSSLKEQLIEITHPKWLGSLESIGSLNHQLGKLFADATNTLIKQESIPRESIRAIGSHGQTLWHQPYGSNPFTMQLGDASLIAEETNITTVADFRSRDIAAGGQGAPLVPAFHLEHLSNTNNNRFVLNIGGIANITILPKADSEILASGYDIGPGNGLIDAWISHHCDKSYDKNGDWGKSGVILPDVLKTLLRDDYFSILPPKSTGKELFNLEWLNRVLGDHLTSEKPEDIQATLTELTAKSITDCINNHNDESNTFNELYVCGGGVHNSFLIERLQQHLPETSITSTEKLGIDPDWMEAIAFAWLAKQTLEGKTSNLPEVTGAKGKRILGAIHLSGNN